MNNVGTAFLRDYSGIEDIAVIPDDDWLGLFQLNVMSGVRLSRHYLPRMVGRGWGRVVFVSIESAVNTPKEMLDWSRHLACIDLRRRGFVVILSSAESYQIPQIMTHGSISVARWT